MVHNHSAHLLVRHGLAPCSATLLRFPPLCTFAERTQSQGHDARYLRAMFPTGTHKADACVMFLELAECIGNQRYYLPSSELRLQDLLTKPNVFTNFSGNLSWHLPNVDMKDVTRSIMLEHVPVLDFDLYIDSAQRCGVHPALLSLTLACAPHPLPAFTLLVPRAVINQKDSIERWVLNSSCPFGTWRMASSVNSRTTITNSRCCTPCAQPHLGSVDERIGAILIRPQEATRLPSDSRSSPSFFSFFFPS